MKDAEYHEWGKLLERKLTMFERDLEALSI